MAGLGVVQAPRESVANDGDNVRVGVNNTGTSTTVLAATVSGGAGLRVTNGTSGGDATADAIQGYATGDSNAGIFGRNDANKGVGVYGTAPSGTGVFGESTAGFGVGGRSTSGSGVRAVSTSGFGVLNTSTSSHGVWGETSSTAIGVVGVNAGSGNGVWGQATSGVGVVGWSPSGTAGHFQGNVTILGNLTVVGSYPKSAAVPHPDGTHRRMYCLEAPESWFEDFGAGQLVGHLAPMSPFSNALTRSERMAKVAALGVWGTGEEWRVGSRTR